MMATVTVCAGVFELCMCSDSASVPDNRVTISASSPSRRNLLSQNFQPTGTNGDANRITPTSGARPSSVRSCLLRLRQLLLQFDELGLEFDHGVHDDARCQGRAQPRWSGRGLSNCRCPRVAEACVAKPLPWRVCRQY